MVSVMTKSQANPLILFDGVCNLCNAGVQLIIKSDPEMLFRFASLQSAVGQQVVHDFKQELLDIDSIVLVHQDRLFLKSEAVLEIFHLLGGFYRLLSIFKFLPLSIRNWIYDWIAGNRYAWFGKMEVCMIPTPELKNRFLS
jgi:predicted DCC family thiol-disulfide oxidoreductase YuxK